jgi:hypothetical protein
MDRLTKWIVASCAAAIVSYVRIAPDGGALPWLLAMAIGAGALLDSWYAVIALPLVVCATVAVWMVTNTRHGGLVLNAEDANPSDTFAIYSLEFIFVAAGVVAGILARRLVRGIIARR